MGKELNHSPASAVEPSRIVADTISVAYASHVAPWADASRSTTKPSVIDVSDRTTSATTCAYLCGNQNVELNIPGTREDAKHSRMSLAPREASPP